MPLRPYGRVLTHPAVLFNRGLVAARAGELGEARDLFAAVVHWCPLDLDARNALALACLQQRDLDAAQRSWDEVLARSPRDERARRGLAELARKRAKAAKTRTKAANKGRTKGR